MDDWGDDKSHLQCALASLERRLRAHGLVINPARRRPRSSSVTRKEGGASPLGENKSTASLLVQSSQRWARPSRSGSRWQPSSLR